MTTSEPGGRRRLGVAINPTAGAGRGERAGRQVLQRLRACGHDVRDLSGANLDEATHRARTAVARGEVDALVVVGGDGMIHLGVQAVAATGTALGVVAVGSGNDFATCLGLPVRDPDSACTALLTALAAGGVRRVDAIRVSSPGRPDQWVAGAVSGGLDAAVNARANAMSRPRGSVRYTVAALAEIVAFRAWAYTLHFEGVTDDGGLPLALAGDGSSGRTWTGRAAMVTAANTDRIGGGIRVTPHAVVDDGLLDVLVAPVLTRAGAATIFPLMFTGRHVRRRDVHVLRARAVTIAPASDRLPDLPAGTSALPEAHGDGERLGPLPVTARAAAGALRVLAATPR
ncbi:diacylglycerol/lipid kinase family protein [Isoptericola croceus]|uniref:diacylglycerol/lipid kinase family protein n=1 Tax=Isoptericola croceus TaxID=3031406 RepID=UPI0023F640C9|nr:diacylglycerol kinase family protein [Isoptericola croceus]